CASLAHHTNCNSSSFDLPQYVPSPQTPSIFDASITDHILTPASRNFPFSRDLHLISCSAIRSSYMHTPNLISSTKRGRNLQEFAETEGPLRPRAVGFELSNGCVTTCSR